MIHGKPPFVFAHALGPLNRPLTRSRDCGTTLSPSDGEREGVRGRFMEREHLQNLDVSWGHEPGIPLTRPSATLSPIGGEGWGEGVRFMESARVPSSLMPHLNDRM